MGFELRALCLQGRCYTTCFFLFFVFFLGFSLLFITSIPHPQFSPVRSSLRGCHQPWPIGEWSHLIRPPWECPHRYVCLKLAVNPACDLVDLGHTHLGGPVVLDTSDATAGGALPQHVEVHEPTCIVLHVGAAPVASKTSARTQSVLYHLSHVPTLFVLVFR
jgi:hypothetical protein